MQKHFNEYDNNNFDKTGENLDYEATSSINFNGIFIRLLYNYNLDYNFLLFKSLIRKLTQAKIFFLSAIMAK